MTYQQHIAEFEQLLADLPALLALPPHDHQPVLCEWRKRLDQPNLAPALSHAMNLPHGIGDWRVVRMIMERQVGSARDFLSGAVEWRLNMESTICQQHRFKVDWIRRQLQFAIANSHYQRLLAILACGPGYEACGLRCKPGTVLCMVDSSRPALDFAKTNVGCHVAGHCQWICDNVLSWSKHNTARCDVVAACGLLDYLDDINAITLFRYVSRFANRMVWTNVGPNPYSLMTRHLLRWNLVERSERDIELIVHKSGWQLTECTQEPTGTTWCVTMEL